MASFEDLTLVFGCYQKPDQPSLLRASFNTKQRKWHIHEAIPATDNASFVVRGRLSNLLYAVAEVDNGSVAAYDCNGIERGRVASGGALPCHLAFAPDERWLAVANYKGASVAILGVDPRQGAIEACELVALVGHGPNASRQEAPHPHWVGFTRDSQWLLVVDLGTDQVLAFRFNRETGRLGERAVAYAAEPGNGPRHLCWHPHHRIAYCVCELSNTIDVLRAELPRFRRIQTISTLPADVVGSSQAAHVSIDATGKRLYVSNRGHDSISVFSIEEDGGLSLLQNIPSFGRWPRCFWLADSDRLLFVGNEHNGTITIFEVSESGLLCPLDATLAAPGVAFLSGI